MTQFEKKDIPYIQSLLKKLPDDSFLHDYGQKIIDELEGKNKPTNLDKRHPSTEHMIMVTRVNPSLPPHLQVIAGDVEDMVDNMISRLPDSPELTAGLRKLLEAKDCFVRAAVFGETVDYRDR